MNHFHDIPEKSLDLRLGVGARRSTETTSDWATAPDTIGKPERTPVPDVDVADTLRRLADPALKDLVNPSDDVAEHALFNRRGRYSSGTFKTSRSHRMPKHL